jgi:hypothetical protein
MPSADVTLNGAPASLESFRDLWAAFVRNTLRLARERRIAPQDDAAFRDMREALFGRYRRLAEAGRFENAPEGFREAVRAAETIESLASLSDDQAESLRDVLRRADHDLDEWYERARREEARLTRFSRRAAADRLKLYVLLPALFGALVAAFAALGLVLFFNR